MLKKKKSFNYKIKIKTTATTGLMSFIILQCQGVIPI